MQISKEYIREDVLKAARMLDEHHGHNSMDILDMHSEAYLLYTVSEYIAILKDHRMAEGKGKKLLNVF